MLAFMMIACLLSMWITNSAVTAMLLPIVRSILNEIFENVIEELLIPGGHFNINNCLGWLQESDLENGLSCSQSVESVAASSVSEIQLVVVSKQQPEEESHK